MPYADLREFLHLLELKGQLVRVTTPVDLQFEVGAICRKVLDARGPALRFDHPGSSQMPLVCNVMATKERLAMALETPVDDVPHEWARRTRELIPPRRVASGPCQENVLVGDQVDLGLLPIPVWNELDGGAFITMPVQISKDPVTGIGNAAPYRSQVFDRNTVGIQAGPFRHIMQHRAKATARNESLPVAIAIGVDPAIFIGASAGVPMGVDELAVAGALRGEPVDVVPCKTIPLDVPATAEIVLEGELPVGYELDEGPFGDVTGYYGVRVKQPAVKLTAMTYRDGAVHHASYVGMPPSETAVIMAMLIEAELWRSISLPGVKAICVTEVSGCLNAVLSIEKPFEGYGKMMGLAVLGTWAGRQLKSVIVVDDDIDPANSNQVEWAVATRVVPQRDIELIGGLNGHSLDPSISFAYKSGLQLTSSKVIIDATKYDAKTFEVACRPDAATARRVDQEWERYGIPLGQSEERCRT